MFGLLKSIHLTAVTLTIAGFVLRGFWMLRQSPLLESRWTRTLPHINDTVLLLSACGCAALLGQYPFVNDWLTAKVIGLLAYIGCGAIALTYGPTRGTRVTALLLAVLCIGYVVAVALTKNPLPFT